MFVLWFVVGDDWRRGSCGETLPGWDRLAVDSL